MREPTRTMTLRLPCSLIDQIRQAAASRGISVNELAKQTLRAHATESDDETRLDIALAKYIGCLGGVPDVPPRENDPFGDILEEKKRLGRL